MPVLLTHIDTVPNSNISQADFELYTRISIFFLFMSVMISDQIRTKLPRDQYSFGSEVQCQIPVALLVIIWVSKNIFFIMNYYFFFMIQKKWNIGKEVIGGQICNTNSKWKKYWLNRLNKSKSLFAHNVILEYLQEE